MPICCWILTGIGVLVLWTVICFIDSLRWKNNPFWKLEQRIRKGGGG